MEKPNTVKKIQLYLKKTGEEKKLTREEFVNRGLGSEKELNGKIFDLTEQIETLRPGKERMEILRQLRSLINERDKPLPPYDWEENGYYVPFYNEELKIDTDGMRDDDEYNSKNWKGHDE
jgi:hypothetical protein